MLGERVEARPNLRLVAITQGTWLRPDVPTPDATPATLPAPYWASSPRRGGLRRSTTRVTVREAFPRRPRRSEIYHLAAVTSEPIVAGPQRSAAEAIPAPVVERERAPLLRLAADLLAQVFKPHA
jgi:hypothetical protein